MKKAPLYSQSRKPAAAPPVTPAARALPPVSTAAAPPLMQRARDRLSAFLARHPRSTWLSTGALLVASGVLIQHLLHPAAAVLTQKDIDSAVRHSLEAEPLPSPYTQAYAAIRPSVVRVMGLADDDDDEVPATRLPPSGKHAKPGHPGANPPPKGSPKGSPQGAPKDSDKAPPPGEASPDDPRSHTRSTGTGVVIIDNGTILTNLHVVAGAKRIRVMFHDGTESDATLINAQPENDLAVLRAKTVPDDLEAATLRSTGDLQPGDQVLAVGFPFGIGPSASGGVVSGLKRQFRSPEGGERLSNLIQFDAAANPGNSGGPLVTMDGAVVGIVTAILNPGDAGTFIGIGFAVPIENAAAAAGMPPF